MQRALAALYTGWFLLAACGGGEESRPTGAPMDPAAQPAAEASDSEPGVDAPPRIERVDLEPRQPRPSDRVTARVDATGRGLRFEYEWRVDGRVVEQGAASSLQLDGSASRGTLVEATVVALDPTNQRSAPASASVRVGNSPPVIQGLDVEPPGKILAGQDVTVRPRASDPDGDSLRFDYRWEVNGVVVGEAGETLPAPRFGSGDSISVTVTASDGQAKSNSVSSSSMTVLNAPPRITSKPSGFDEEGRFVYKIEAEDPDGDTRFRYRLLEAPSGMELDTVDATVRWTPREDQAGKHGVKIEVSDSQGATTTQSFWLTLDFGVGGEGAGEAPPAATE